MVLRGGRKFRGWGALWRIICPGDTRRMKNNQRIWEQAFKNHLDEAIREEPTDNAVLGGVVTGTGESAARDRPAEDWSAAGSGAGRGGFGGGGFGRAGVSRPAVLGVPRIVTEAARVDSPQSRAKWQSQSLATVMAMHGMEEVLGDQISACAGVWGKFRGG